LRFASHPDPQRALTAQFIQRFPRTITVFRKQGKPSRATAPALREKGKMGLVDICVNFFKNLSLQRRNDARISGCFVFFSVVRVGARRVG
jgi:hypothetical protein